MKTREQIQQIINKYVEAINKIVKELGPDDPITDKKIVGLLILEFPEDHGKTTHIYTTAVGRICFSHTFEYLERLQAGQILEANKLAS